MRSAAVAFLASRAYIVIVGAIAYLALEHGHGVETITLEPYSRLGDILTATSVRYDSGWYGAIAMLGYESDPLRAAFPPAYPVLMWALTPLTRPFVGSDVGATLLAGLIISWTTFPVALYLLHQLVAVDFGAEVAGRAVILLAAFPMSFYFSAVYAESLFLALSVGSIYAARRGRWAVAGALGALASATRLQGLLILIPLGLMLLYGPRADGRPTPTRGWRPRYPGEAVRRGAWVVLVPLGLVAFVAYLWVALGDPMATLHAQREGWDRQSAIPLVSAYLGLDDAAWAVDRVVLGFSPLSDLATRAPLTDAAFFAFGVAAITGALRRLPAAYSGYSLAGLLFVLSSVPDSGREHLLSMPRFLAVLFPIFIWLAIWARTPRRWWGTVSASVLLLGFYSAVVATGRWVA